MGDLHGLYGGSASPKLTLIFLNHLQCNQCRFPRVAEVWRERTFFLAEKEGFDFFAGHEAKFLPISDLKMMPRCTWHPTTRPVLRNWLSETQSSLDKERLKAIGNAVMPNVARMAFQLLATSGES